MEKRNKRDIKILLIKVLAFAILLSLLLAAGVINFDFFGYYLLYTIAGVLFLVILIAVVHLVLLFRKRMHDKKQ